MRALFTSSLLSFTAFLLFHDNTTRPKPPQKTNTHTHTLHTHIPGVCVARQQFVLLSMLFYCLFFLFGLVYGILLLFLACFCHRENQKSPCSSIKEFSSRKGDENNITTLFRLHLLCASRARSAGIATPTVLSDCRHRISTINKTVNYDDDYSTTFPLSQNQGRRKRRIVARGDPSRSGSNGREGDD